MLPPLRYSICLAAALAVFGNSVHAQRQMEKLGRGVVALRTSSSQVYVGWRLLGTDPDSIGFNLYRSTGGGIALKLNSLPLTNTTDYVDTRANLALTNAWFIRPVLNGLEQAPSAACGLPANAPSRKYFAVPLHAVTGGAFPPYDVKFCWVGDFDGDGEYDFVVDRLSTTGSVNQYLQAYLRNGTFLWQMDMGYNSTNQYNIEPGASAISIGDKDNVTVYDLDGDGRAEVIVRVARGTVLPDGTVVTGPDDTTQYLSVLDGLTGKERARATIPNPWPGDGPMNFRCGILYCDGVRPSVLLSGENRIGSGAFQRINVTWDFRNGVLTQRWFWTPPASSNYAWSHQLRIADVNHDGIDDVVEVGSVNNGATGQPLFDNDLQHGDRLHITDMDPDRPGLETYAIQQRNTALVTAALYQSASGKFIKKWYSAGIVDVGRGVALDYDPRYRGVEMYSTQPGTFDCQGHQISTSTFSGVPPEGLWWDADLLRETIDGPNAEKTSPVINKPNYLANNYSRLYSIYNEGVHQAYGGRAAFWGDIGGDWREELVLVANDYSEIRVYMSTIPAANRLYCLMQDPAYRCQATVKGYYEANYPDYYLGNDMEPPPPPPLSDAALVWRGGLNVWDAGTTANWFTNNLWISNSVSTVFNDGNTVLFDLTGSNQAPVNLAGMLAPGAVTVHCPRDYFFVGSGSLTGPMKLTKAGAGKLTLGGTNTFSGVTTVWEGPLVVEGSLSASPVVVRSGAWLDAALAGSGFVGGGATLYRNASLSPGNFAAPGTLTISNGLVEINGAFNRFRLSDDPTGTKKTNDLVRVIGNLTLTGTNVIYLTPLNTNLAAGTYSLITYSGTLHGGLSNLLVDGLPGIPVELASAPGQIALVVKSYRPPATVTWLGGAGGNAWDLLTSSNWLNGATRDQFAPLDSVRFDNTGAGNPVITLTGWLKPAEVVVDTTSNFTWTGSGGIIGAAALMKSNTGTLTISATANAFTGRTWIAGGTVVVPELGPVGFPSPLGNPGAQPTNLVLSGNSTLRVTGESFTDRGLTLDSGTNGMDVLNAADQVTMAGGIVGPGALEKRGAGTLALTASNSFSGGTFIRSGNVSLGGGNANRYALGTGLVTLDNGTLTMFSDSSSYDNVYWNLFVPAGSTGTVYADDRCNLYGSLTGGGALNFNVYYVRTELDGNWSGFTGQINFGTDSGGGDFRIRNSYGYPNASVYLPSGISAYHVTGGAVSLGALSGSAGSWLSGTPWTVGAKGTDAVYAGTITGNSVTKVGTGNWTLTGTNTYSGPTVISNGTLTVNGSLGNTAVTVYGTLAGGGAIGGPVVVPSGGKLSPGAGLGTLTLSNALTLMPGSTVRIELNAALHSSDSLRVGGVLTYGGTLAATNLSPQSPAAGNHFQLFSAAGYSGSFSSQNLPTLSAGLAWNSSRLAVDGTLWVVSTESPVFGAPLVSGTNLALSVSGGTPGWPCYLLTSTNVNLPIAAWMPLATNQFNSGGSSRFVVPFMAADPERFYRLEVP